MEADDEALNRVGVGCWLEVAFLAATILVWFGSWGRHIAGWIFLLVGAVVSSWFGWGLIRSEWDRPPIVMKYGSQFILLGLGLVVVGGLLAFR